MLNLIYDIKCGFNDLYIVEKDVEEDLTGVVEMNKDCLAFEFPDDIELTEEELEEKQDFIEYNPISEEQLYNKYKDDIDGLIAYLEDNGTLDASEEATREYYAHAYFSSICFNKETGESCVPGICDYSNYRLEYDPNKRSSFYFDNAMGAGEVCSLLNITRQQLHYYFKSGQIRKEYDTDGVKFKYNRSDVYAVLDKLKAKQKLHNKEINKKLYIKQ